MLASLQALREQLVSGGADEIDATMSAVEAAERKVLGLRPRPARSSGDSPLHRRGSAGEKLL
jgi:hypothetical protein